jgi:hypothetical protein
LVHRFQYARRRGALGHADVTPEESLGAASHFSSHHHGQTLRSYITCIMNSLGRRRNSDARPPTQRPPSSGSARPASALSRPSSRVAQRPQSSLTVRPPSAASQRAQSRLSHRPQSRSSRTKILPHCQSLVGQVAGVQDPESDEYQQLVEDVVRRLESVTISKLSASVDMSVIDRAISGSVILDDY